MANYNEDELKFILWEKFRYKNIDRYGGQTIEYWSECRRVTEERLRAIRIILDSGDEGEIEEIEELEEGYLEKLSKERDETLRRERDDKRKRLEAIPPPVITPPDVPAIEPPRGRWKLFGFGRKQQRPNKGDEPKK